MSSQHTRHQSKVCPECKKKVYYHGFCSEECETKFEKDIEEIKGEIKNE